MEAKRRAIRLALFHGKCLEVNNATHQLMERSSLLEEGTSATVALIMLPIHMQSHEHQTLQRFVEMARKTAETNGWGNLQIVCARKVELYAEKRTAREEAERAEEEGIRQILLSLPSGSCAIPSSESKRVKILTYCHTGYRSNDKLSFFMANVGVNIQGCQFLQYSKFSTEDDLGNVVLRTLFPEKNKALPKHHNSIQNFIKSISVYGKSQSGSECIAGESKTGEFMEALKGSGIHYLLNDNSTCKVMIDDLHGKAIGFIICDFKVFKCIKLQQIYIDLQQKDSNFIWIWIPTFWPENYGHGTYTRLTECMPWAVFPCPHLVKVGIDRPYLVLLEKDGHIANRDALPLLMGWGLKASPFTQHTIPQSFFLVESESYLEFLLHGMNIVGRKPMRRKMTILYAAHPLEWLGMKYELEELTPILSCLEVLYVGNFYETDICSDIENVKQGYEDATQNMRWPSLSFADMIMFWYRCKYFAKLENDSNLMMNNLHVFAYKLYFVDRAYPLVLVHNNGEVISHGKDLVRMISSR